MNTLKKWIETIRISLNQQTTYRLNFFLQVIGPGLVFFFVKYSLWNTIYSGNSETLIAGMNRAQMINYHSWVFVVALLTQGHASFNLSEDIRMGRISTYLIYPFDFWEFHTAGFLAFQILQIFIAIISCAVLYFSGLLILPTLSQLGFALALCFMVSFFWYFLQYLTGLLAFWLDETWIMRVMLQIVTTFLSGAILPLSIFPYWLSHSLKNSPFPIMVYYPVRAFMGELPFSTAPFLTLLPWMILLFFLNVLVWKKGLRLYTAAGM